MDTSTNRSLGLQTRHEGKKCCMEIPGFTFADYDRHGHISLWSAAKYMEYNIFFPEHRALYRDTTYMGVIVGQKFTFSRSLYSRSSIIHPMIYTSRPGSIGRTSFVLFSDLIKKSTNEPLIHNERLFVVIGRKSRRPIQVPVQDFPFEFEKENRSSFRIEVCKKRPVCAYEYHKNAEFSDHDGNHHVGAFAYLRWLMDAAAEACHNGALPSHGGELRLCAKSLEILNYHECHAGDHIRVYVWEEETAPDCQQSSNSSTRNNSRNSSHMTLCFDVEKQSRDGTHRKAVFARVTFYHTLFPCRI